MNRYLVIFYVGMLLAGSVLLVVFSTGLGVSHRIWLVVVCALLFTAIALLFVGVHLVGVAATSAARIGVIGAPLIILLGALALSISDVPFSIRWQLEEDQFSRAALRIESGADVDSYADEVIGTRRIDRVWTLGDDQIVFFDFYGYSFLECEDSGVAYTQPGDDPREIAFYSQASFVELGKGWWRYQLCRTSETGIDRGR